MTGNLPERGYARGERVCNDGFRDAARTNGTLNVVRAPPSEQAAFRVGGPRKLPAAADWNNDGYRSDCFDCWIEAASVMCTDAIRCAMYRGTLGKIETFVMVPSICLVHFLFDICPIGCDGSWIFCM